MEFEIDVYFDFFNIYSCCRFSGCKLIYLVIVLVVF